MRQNRRTVIGLIAFVGVLMVITLVAGRRLENKLAAGEVRLKALEKSIEEEHARTEEIRQLQKYMQSDEYKEQVAKDKLGLIRDGEIIFKEADKD